MGKRNLFIGLAFFLGAVLLSLGLAVVAPCVRCGLRLFVPAGRSLDKVHFFSCTNVRQRLDRSKFYNIREEPADVDGWRMFTVVDPAKKGYVFLTVRKDRQQMIFYPRVSRPTGIVWVYSQEGYTRSPLFSSGDHPREQGWSEIGMQYAIDLSCIKEEDRTKEVDIQLVVVLRGPGAQLWFKDDGVFF